MPQTTFNRTKHRCDKVVFADNMLSTAKHSGHYAQVNHELQKTRLPTSRQLPIKRRTSCEV